MRVSRRGGGEGLKDDKFEGRGMRELYRHISVLDSGYKRKHGTEGIL